MLPKAVLIRVRRRGGSSRMLSEREQIRDARGMDAQHENHGRGRRTFVGDLEARANSHRITASVCRRRFRRVDVPRT